MESQYFVYVYFDPATLMPFYVGKGKNQRHRFHIREAFKYKAGDKQVRHLNIPKIKKILSIMELAKEPVVTKVFWGSHEECLTEECRLVSLYGRYPNGPLLNQTDGGDGTCGYKHSPETRNLFSQQRKGKAVTKHSEEHKQRMCEDNAGGRATRKKVLKLLPNGTVLATFESMTAAAKSVGWTKNNFSHAVVKDGSLPLQGAFYRYEASDDIAIDGIRDAATLIAQRDKADRNARAAKAVRKVSGSEVTIYESIKDAARAHPEIKYATLWSAIKHGRAQGGAVWTYL
jgi:hypothetical protein